MTGNIFIIQTFYNMPNYHCQNGVEWNVMDGEPVKFVISLLIPKNESGSTHIRILSTLSRLLIHVDFLNKLLTAASVDEVVNEINGSLNALLSN